MEGRQVAQWDKDSCGDAGFLKIDLLGLGMLSAVERCVELIAQTRGERVDLSRIPYDDPATFGAIQRAETTGVFQIESRAQMQSLYRTRPENLDDLTIQVAIVRPGPIQGGAVNPYIKRLQRLRVEPDYEVPYDHPSLEPVLRDTLGTIIFQDQVIEVAQAFAGFSPGQAEGLRRAMSRRRSEAAIEAYHRDFVTGAVARHGIDDARAERVWDMVKGFSGFGFPQGPRRGLRPARLPVHLAARALRAGAPVLAAQRAADGLLSARRPRARGPAPRHRRARRRRQRQRGGLHGGAGGRRLRSRPSSRAGRAGLRERGARRGGRSDRGGARARRPVPQRGRPGGACRHRARLARRPGLGRRMRRARPRRAARRPVAARGRRLAAGGRPARARAAASSPCRSVPRGRRSCRS